MPLVQRRLSSDAPCKPLWLFSLYKPAIMRQPEQRQVSSSSHLQTSYSRRVTQRGPTGDSSTPPARWHPSDHPPERLTQLRSPPADPDRARPQAPEHPPAPTPPGLTLTGTGDQKALPAQAAAGTRPAPASPRAELPHFPLVHTRPGGGQERERAPGDPSRPALRRLQPFPAERPSPAAAYSRPVQSHRPPAAAHLHRSR